MAIFEIFGTLYNPGFIIVYYRYVYARLLRKLLLEGGVHWALLVLLKNLKNKNLNGLLIRNLSNYAVYYPF